MLAADLQIRYHGSVNAVHPRVFFPDAEIGLHVEPLHTVKGHDIEVTDRAIVLRRIAGGNDDESFRHPMGSECLILQELQHRRCERFGNAVDLIEKKDSLGHAAALDLIIDRRDDLTHRVLRDGVFFPAVIPFCDERKADRALACVMRNGVRNETDTEFFCDLSHDCGLPDAGSSYHEDRALALGGYQGRAGLVLGEIGFDRVYNFLFCFLYVHSHPPLNMSQRS